MGVLFEDFPIGTALQKIGNVDFLESDSFLKLFQCIQVRFFHFIC